MNARLGPLSAPNLGQLGRVPRAVYWAAALALLIPVWVGSRFPTEDGPAHVYYTEVYRRLGDPESIYAPFYERSVQWNTPNLTYFGLQYALGRHLDPYLAQRVAVTLILLALAATTFVLSETIVGGVGVGAVASLLLMHNSFLYAGYFSFLAGIPFLLLTVALLTGPLEWPRASSSSMVLSLTAIFSLGILVYYSHLVVAGMFVLLVGLRVVYWPGAPLSQRALLGLAAAPVIVLIMIYMLGPATGKGGAHWIQPTEVFRSLEQLRFWQGFAAPDLGYRVRRWTFTIVLAFLVYWNLRGLMAGTGSRARQFVFVAGAVMLLLRLVLPDGLGQGGVLSERMDLMIWAFVLPALSAPTAGRVYAWLTVILLLVLGSQLVDTALRIHRFDRAYAPVEAAAARIPTGSVIRTAPSRAGINFEGAYPRILSELTQEVAMSCGCIMVAGHHPNTPYYWVRQRPGIDIGAALLVRVEPVGSPERGRQGLSLRVTEGERSPR